ncbi:MAG: YbdD/YjiX family protein [Propionibacteriaceae bacterium]|jgi:uncharacterized short protein YbdD (DUF466 family)|nr:YbdD/YjiX family protein [Propionibacteriaceae bacterium]
MMLLTAIAEVEAKPKRSCCIRRAWRSCCWFLREASGQNAYAHYLARWELEHPGEEPLGEREFWRMRMGEHAAEGCC